LQPPLFTDLRSGGGKRRTALSRAQSPAAGTAVRGESMSCHGAGQEPGSFFDAIFFTFFTDKT